MNGSQTRTAGTSILALAILLGFGTTFVNTLRIANLKQQEKQEVYGSEKYMAFAQADNNAFVWQISGLVLIAGVGVGAVGRLLIAEGTDKLRLEESRANDKAAKPFLD